LAFELEENAQFNQSFSFALVAEHAFAGRVDLAQVAGAYSGQSRAGRTSDVHNSTGGKITL